MCPDFAETGQEGHEIVGTSRAMERVRRQIHRASRLEVPLLITGEPGSGRELAARAIHFGSARAGRPFVAVHLGSVPERIIEAELFGRQLTAAHRGTIFIDGIADLPAGSQSKLFRAMVKRQVDSGNGGRPLPADARVIAAGHGEVETAAQRVSLKPELFTALSSFSIHLPTLRERKTDLTLLAEHFLRIYASRHQKKVVRISTPALDLLTSYAWPGNVRELEDVIA